ncbi:MAG: YceI family protein [Parvularcula sp.]
MSMAHNRSPATRYNAVSVALHWTMAVLIIVQLAGGKYMHDLPLTAPGKFDLYQIHKSIGIALGLLAFIRLGWRLRHPIPPLPTSMPIWQRKLARSAHWAFYALMILIPMVGWAMISVSPLGIPTKWFGLFGVPSLPIAGLFADRAAATDLFASAHEYLALALAALLVLHVGAAFKHMFFDRDGVMGTMTHSKKWLWMSVAGFLALMAALAITYPSAARASSSQAAAAENVQWTVDMTKSRLGFTGQIGDQTFSGRFPGFSAAIALDPKDLSNASIQVSVMPATVTTDNDTRDDMLPQEEWFDTKRHPTATFVSTSVQRPSSQYTADGTLTIKGNSQPATLTFDLSIEGDHAVATGGVALDRTLFGIGLSPIWLDQYGVARTVTVDFEIHATRQNQAID